jgi:molecular chaperone GrpE
MHAYKKYYCPPRCESNKKHLQVFKKFGVEKFDPLNEKFDPNRHYAIFQIPDPSKPSGTVAAVVKVCIS